MSCQSKIECERLKNIQHAKVLASQAANLTGKKLAVVKLHHQSYGDYYKGIPYAEAQRKKLKIYETFEPGQTMKKKKSAKGRKIDK